MPGSLPKVRANPPPPREHLKNQVFLGSDSFVESMRRQVPQNRDLREVPQAKRRPPAKALPEYARAYLQRNDAIVAAYRSGGYTLRDIGDYFSLHYSRISKIVRAASLAAREEKGKTLFSNVVLVRYVMLQIDQHPRMPNKQRQTDHIHRRQVQVAHIR
jgi:hypothetical protein